MENIKIILIFLAILFGLIMFNVIFFGIVIFVKILKYIIIAGIAAYLIHLYKKRKNKNKDESNMGI